MIRKALIPIAGLGTRMYPLTKVISKAMLPLPFDDENVLPVVHWICAEAAAGGVEVVMLIVSPSQEQVVREYFIAVDPGCPLPLPENIEFTVQEKPEGFGDAIVRGASFVGDEPFLVMLGDHVYASSSSELSCAAQVVKAHERCGGAAMIGMQPVRADELIRVGVARGEPHEGRVLRCRELIEKPDLETARERLITPGLPEGEFLAHCGIYLFGPEIFECLSVLSRTRRPGGHEVELAAAQKILLQRYPEDYFLYRIDGRAFDTGTPAMYAQAFTELAGRNK
ncbi:MAG: sugar phosphate nucleotidyltransferase [Planctomycetota bacterium]|jgi:UTP--glucose-1-phosphate uridylyltransferase